MQASAESRSSGSRFVLHDAGSARNDFAADVRAGLTAAGKALPPRWFYDDVGSALFDAICLLPEYYVTRAEIEILRSASAEISRSFGTAGRIVELGSGTARKTRHLLSAISVRQPELEYVPVDVDAAMLERTGRELLAEYAALRVSAICSDFAQPAAVLEMLPPSPRRTAVLFLGSTIGNLDPDEAAAMLRDLRRSLATGDALLLGVDLRKPREIIEAAYDDALGVTAAFNLNILARINRELGGHFDLATFRHRAFYDEAHGRIEMHLVSMREQRVAIDALALEIAFDEGETIHTESSYKYDDASLAALAEAAGFMIERRWTDARQWFADVLMIAA